MSQHVQNLFDSIAPKYDLLNSLLSFNADQKWRKEAVSTIAAARFEKVLDLCAGTLVLTTTLLNRNPNVHITAVDFSEAMIEEGKKNLPEAYRSAIQCLVADAMTLSFPPESYDAIMCAYGMRNIDNNEIVLKKIRTWLKPGGKLVILDFFRPENFLSRVFNLTYAECVIPLLGKLVSRNAEAYKHLRDSVRNFHTPSEYKKLLEKLGFQKMTVKAQTGGISHLITAEVG